MKRKLYPYSGRDRFLFWSNIINLLISIFLFTLWINHKSEIDLLRTSIIFLVVAIFGISLVYLIQDIPPQSSSNEYARIINEIKNMGTKLDFLNRFLEKEQKRVEDTEATIIKLQNEKTKLEPLVLL